MKQHRPNTLHTLAKLAFSISLLCSAQQTFAQLSSYSFAGLSGVAPEDMTSGTVLVNSNVDDGASSIINIGFIFTFRGTSYTQFSVNSNGLMSLGSALVSNVATNQLTSITNNPKIAPYWDDLKTGSDGKVHYKLIGSSPNQKLCVEWVVTVPKNASTTSNTKFQAWLFEGTNVIQFVYGNGSGILANPGGYSVGIVNSSSDYLSVTTSSATVSSSVENNTNTTAISDQTSYKFTPPVATGIPNCVSTFSPATGSTGVTTATTLTWTSGGGVPSGYDVYFGTSAAPPLVSTNQVSTNYNPGTLAGNTTYFWKVIPKNSFGSASGCTVNSFTTFTPLNYDVTRFTNSAFNSISATGNSVASWRNGTNTDDNLSNAVPIGFNFIYQGVTYSNVLISTNGFLTFNTSTAETGGGAAYNGNNINFSSSGSPLMIAPFYDDLVCEGNPFTDVRLAASVKYLVSGSVGSRIFTVEWIKMQTSQSAGPNLNFQARLYETSGNIEFTYGTMEGFNGTSNFNFSYSVGINASFISTAPATGELLTQEISNTRNFGTTPSFNLNVVPECSSRLLFTPGNYTPYFPVSVNIANDNPAGAVSLAVNSSPCVSLCGTYYSSSGATLSSGVPVCTGNADDDVWFTFVATNPATTIKVLSSGGYDAVAELVNSSLTSITCQNATASGLTETISTTNLISGNSYYVRVYNSGSSSGTNGTFSICVSATPLPPVNDECSGAISLKDTSSFTTVTGTNTTTATASAGVPVPCNGTTADDDVWYFFNAVTTSATIVVQSGSGFDAAVELFSGSCGSLVVLQCANASSTGGSESIFASGLTIGAPYYIRVYHATLGAGSGSFTIGVSSATPNCIPPLATNFNPPNGTAHLSPNGVTLSWAKSSGATGYDIYMDSITPPVILKASNVVDTNFFSGPLTPGYTYYWQVRPRNGAGITSGCYINSFAPIQPDVGMYVKVFLSGFYAGNRTMRAVVNPALYPTLTDTITVALAQSTTPYSIMFSSKAALATNGTAHPMFPAEALIGNYYIVIKHRNSLETWSYSPVGFNTGDTTFDFTTPRGVGFIRTNNRPSGTSQPIPVPGGQDLNELVVPKIPYDNQGRERKDSLPYEEMHGYIRAEQFVPGTTKT